MYLTRRRKRRRGRERGRRRRTPPALWGTTVRTANKVNQRTVSNGIEEIVNMIEKREEIKKGSGKFYQMFGKR